MSTATAFALTVVLAASSPNPANASGTILHVAKHGKDSYSCTQALNPSTPKLTINAALACIGTKVGAGASKTVRVHAGVYSEGLFNNLPIANSSWSMPFILEANPGDSVTIRRPTPGDNLLIQHATANFYAIIRGFIFDGANTCSGAPCGYKSQFRIGSNTVGPKFIRFENNTFINNQAGSNTGSASSNLEFIGNTWYGGPFYCASCVGGDHSYPLYLMGGNNLVEGNKIYNVPAFAIHIYNNGSTSPRNNVVRSNQIYNFGYKRTSAGILLASGDNNQAYNNVVHHSNSACAKFSNSGITAGYGATNSKIYKNTVYANCKGIETFNTTNPTVRDNNVYQNLTNLILQGTGVVSYNNITSAP